MADSDKLRNYLYANQPQLDGNDRKYLKGEFEKLQQSVSLLVTVVKQLETRMAAHGI